MKTNKNRGEAGQKEGPTEIKITKHVGKSPLCIRHRTRWSVEKRIVFTETK